ncbi:MAG: efflux RND transporter permease subunit [Cyclobacteriaceae bacterium]
MKLPSIAIKNYQFVLILVALASLYGITSYLTMKRSEDPFMNGPYYVITVVYPGTGPKDMEELVVDPIEEVIDELEDIKQINTTIDEGLAFIQVEGLWGVDPDEQYDEVVAEINSIKPSLPDDIFRIEVTHSTPKEVSILQLALTSETASYRRMQDYAEELEKILKKVNGVRTVDVLAYPEQEVRVSLDFQKMANQNVALSQVINTLQGNNANVPGGNVKSGGRSFTVKTSGGYKTLEELQSTAIASGDGKLVYLRDIADVHFDYEDQQYYARFNGERALFLSVTQKEEVNILDLTEDMNAAVVDFQSQLPNELNLEYAFIQGPSVAQRIQGFVGNLGQGVALIGIIVLIFLGVRSAAVIITVIPTTIIISIGILNGAGFGLHQISIVGLVIALGLLVDNAIVVVENITRFMQEGYSLRQAAAKGTAEVGTAVVSSTVTTVLSIMPLAIMDGSVGEFLRSMPLIVIFALVTSLILAITFTPILSRYLLKAPRNRQKVSRIDRIIQRTIEGPYRRTLNFGLRRPAFTLVLAVLTFVGGVALFPLVGVSLFPTADKPLYLVDIETPKGSNLDKTDAAARFVESVVDTLPGVESYATNVGHGNPQIYYNRFSKSYTRNYAQVLVNLDAYEEERFYATLNQLRDTFSQYPEARITLSELKQGVPVEAPIAIKIIGKDLETIKSIGKDVEELFERTAGTVNTYNPLAIDKTDIKVDINRDKAGLIGLSLYDIDLAVRTSLTGLSVDEMTMDNGDQFDIVVRLPYDQQLTLDDFNKIYTTNITGDKVPLNQVAKLTFARSNSQIDHYNTDRTVTITADVLDDYNIMAVTQEILDELDQYDFPEGYSYYAAGEYEAQQESFGNTGQSLLIALIAIFAVLVLQFKSFRQPMIVFSAIPLAFTGSIVALFITGWTFSFFAFVGFTSLVGIVINTSIILIDYTNQLRDSGMRMVRAIKKAAETRFKPIVLTTLTTILGLLPLTLSSGDLWPPLGWTIIGGMISSTFLTLLIVPILYKLFTKEQMVIEEEEEMLVAG